MDMYVLLLGLYLCVDIIANSRHNIHCVRQHYQASLNGRIGYTKKFVMIICTLMNVVRVFKCTKNEHGNVCYAMFYNVK